MKFHENHDLSRSSAWKCQQPPATPGIMDRSTFANSTIKLPSWIETMTFKHRIIVVCTWKILSLHLKSIKSNFLNPKSIFQTRTQLYDICASGSHYLMKTILFSRYRIVNLSMLWVKYFPPAKQRLDICLMIIEMLGHRRTP